MPFQFPDPSVSTTATLPNGEKWEYVKGAWRPVNLTDDDQAQINVLIAEDGKQDAEIEALKQEPPALADEDLISEQPLEPLVEQSIQEPIKEADPVIANPDDEPIETAKAEVEEPKEINIPENKADSSSEPELKKTKRVIKAVPSFKLSELDVSNDKKEEQEEEAKVSIKKDVELNQEDLAKAWKSYCEKCEKEGSSYILSLLKNLKPKVHEYNVYKVVVGHKVEREKLLAQNRDIADFMSGTLGEEVVMDIVVKEREKASSDLAYTNRDKFKRMLEKNPKLMDFKNGLDLEVDY